MKDRLGTELNIGDIVVHIRASRNYVRLVPRRITHFNKDRLILDDKHHVYPQNVFKTYDEHFILGESY
ncbi:MAG: hypothetical protein M0R17_03100 [Candidatus Omnitrophica bacterium]|jgi:hypothetical protein|nr:hypothetical protein [Candidatus Omnitrophota bacterium]